MKSFQTCIDQMHLLLDELIQVATQLRDMSLQVISEEDLTFLQKRQENLLLELENIDQQLQDKFRHQVEPEMEKYVHNQLQLFQQLNQEFIQNLNTSHGVIQFELRRFEGEEEIYSSRSRLKKASLSRNSAKTIKSKENKKG